MAEAVSRARDGAPEAFTELVRRFQDMAVGYAWSLLGDFHLAQDAAQDAFIQVFGDLHNLREAAAFPGWLRHTRRAELSTVPLEGIQNITADFNDSTPLDELERAETAVVIRRAVAALPEHQRETVTLYYISEHSQSEIATFLDISEGAVRKRLHDARHALKETFLDMVKTTLHNDAPSRDDRFEKHVLLGAAAERGDVEQVRRILATAPELARQDSASNDEHQPLHYAVYGNQLEVVQLLLEMGADPLKGIYPHREATSPRAMAFDRGLTAVVAAIDAHLAEQRGTSDAGGDLGEAAARGDGVRVTAILDGEVDVLEARDDRGRTALHRAVQGGTWIFWRCCWIGEPRLMWKTRLAVALCNWRWITVGKRRMTNTRPTQRWHNCSSSGRRATICGPPPAWEMLTLFVRGWRRAPTPSTGTARTPRSQSPLFGAMPRS